MDKDEENEYNELRLEVDKLYEFFEKFVKDLETEKTTEFFNNLRELVDIEIKLEGFCGR